MSTDGAPGTPEAPASGETVQEILADAANESATQDGGETASDETDQSQKIKELEDKLSKLETERPLWLKGKQELQQEREARLRLEGEITALRGSADRATDSGRPKIDYNALAKREAEYQQLADQGNEDAAIMLSTIQQNRDLAMQVQLMDYPSDDRPFLKRLMATN